MKKPEKQMEYPILELYRQRWSPRALADTPIEMGKIQQLFEAARWTASAFNEQPWQFHFAQNGSLGYLKIADALVPHNQAWATKAPLLVVVSAKQTFDRNGKVNAHAAYDAGAAVWSLVTQATSMDLYVHQMAGFYTNKIKAILKLSDNYKPLVIMAIGYLGTLEQLSDNQVQKELREQQRKKQTDFCFELK